MFWATGSESYPATPGSVSSYSDFCKMIKNILLLLQQTVAILSSPWPATKYFCSAITLMAEVPLFGDS